MQITVLVDNLAPETLLCEWGLSFYITFEGENYLLDMGGSGAFAENADRLGISLADVKCAFLSHAHYDHSDGMDAFFERNKTAPLYIREGTLENCYGKNAEDMLHYIGIKEGSLTRYADRIRYASGDEEISPGVYLVPHKTEGLEKVGERVGMKIRIGDRYETDTFRHEQSLVFRTDKGLVVFNSCSHAGPDVIIREISRTFPGEHIFAYLGGLHQFRSSRYEVQQLADLLKEQDVDHIYTGHCTGDEAFGILHETLGDKIVQFCSGYQVTI